MMERQWREYFRQARGYLYCTRREREMFERRIRDAVRELQEEQPHITFAQCVKILGTPEEAARAYMENFSAKYIAAQKRARRLRQRLLLGGGLAVLLALALCLWYGLRTGAAQAGSGWLVLDGAGAVKSSVSSVVWLLALAAFIVLEAVTVRLVTIWFAVGAMAAFAASAFTASWLTQLAVFAAVSTAALAATRPLVKKYVYARRRVPTNADRNIGRRARVLTEITPETTGRVRLDGVDWQARSARTLPAGALCEVERVEGTTLFVSGMGGVRAAADPAEDGQPVR